MRTSIIARTLPVSPQATTVTYRCRRRIDVSSTNNTRAALAGCVGAGWRDDGDPLVVEHCCYLKAATQALDN